MPVFRSFISISGVLALPESPSYPNGSRPLPGETALVLGLGDMRGICRVSPLSIGGQAVEFRPAQGHLQGIEAPLSPLMVGNLDDLISGLPFSWEMEVDGGGGVTVIPTGRDSWVELEGD